MNQLCILAFVIFQICCGCKLRTSCKFPNRTAREMYKVLPEDVRTCCKFPNQRAREMNKVFPEDVMRLLAVYALYSVPPQLVVPDELRSSVGKLVKVVVK